MGKAAQVLPLKSILVSFFNSIWLRKRDDTYDYVYVTVKCDTPLLGAIAKDSVRVIADNSDKETDIIVQGTNVTFICPPGLVPTGPNTSMCLENGEWEPDLNFVDPNCKGDKIFLIVEVLLFNYSTIIRI